MNSRVPVPRVLREASETFFMFRRRRCFQFADLEPIWKTRDSAR
tara:strand:+ start:398 stop:529 length:132 start_codon:yes stop_codon:yes gene_type:complete